MPSALKKVSVGEVEAAIASALQKFAQEGYEVKVSISDLKFSDTHSRVELALCAWEKNVGDSPF